MKSISLRNSLVTASLAAALGIGMSACDRSPDGSASETRGSDMAATATDASITTLVKASLTADTDIRSRDISVETNDGVVTLTGQVRTAEEKSAAAHATGSVAGVKSVRNDLSVPRTSSTAAGAEQAVSDTWITTRVKANLMADQISQGFDVSVETSEGWVTLNGTLHDQDAVDHVRDIASGVDGVKGVDASALVVGASAY